MDGPVAALLAAVSPTPSPTPAIDPDIVTPGVWGFVAIAALAVAVIVLIYDMMRRIRRGRYRAEVREQLDAEEAGQPPDDADGEPGPGAPRT